MENEIFLVKRKIIHEGNKNRLWGMKSEKVKYKEKFLLIFYL
jgi:hypothetical protein